jgi:hypothetical protein
MLNSCALEELIFIVCDGASFYRFSGAVMAPD